MVIQATGHLRILMTCKTISGRMDTQMQGYLDEQVADHSVLEYDKYVEKTANFLHHSA